MNGLSPAELNQLRSVAAKHIPGTTITVEFSEKDGHNVVIHYPGVEDQINVWELTSRADLFERIASSIESRHFHVINYEPAA